MITRKTPLRKQSAKRAALYPKAFSTIIPKKCSGPVLKKSGKPLKARAKKRDRNDKARIYGPPTFVTFLHAHECLGCGICGEMVQQAHLTNGGTGRKAGWQETVPLCGSWSRWEIRRDKPTWVIRVGCHREYDSAKQSDFAQKIRALHAQFWARWCLFCGKSGLDPQTGKPLQESR